MSVGCVVVFVLLMLDLSFELTVLNAFLTKLRPPLRFAQLLVELLLVGVCGVWALFANGTDVYLDNFVLIAQFWFVLIIVFFC